MSPTALSSSSLVSLLGIWSFLVFVWTIQTRPGILLQTGSALSRTNLSPFVQNISAFASITCMCRSISCCANALTIKKNPTFLHLSFKCVSFIKVEFDYLITIETNMYMYVIYIWHAQIQGNFCQGGQGPTARKVVVVFFIPQFILQFYRGLQCLFQRKIYFSKA